MTENTAGKVTALVREDEHERVSLWQSTVAPGADAGLTALVWHYARSLQLDPLRREVMLITMDRKAWGDQPASKEHAVIVNVHGLVKLMGRQKDYAGMTSGVVYPGERCVVKADGTVEHEYDIAQRAKLAVEGAARVLPVGAWCCVERMMHGAIKKFTTYLPFVQVAQTAWKAEWKDGKPTGKKSKQLRDIWASRPDWMCEKCAIAFSVRKAYDHVIGIVYAAEEFGGVSTEDGITIPAGSFDHEGSRADVLDEAGATVTPEGTPSVEAGLISGSETPEGEPADSLVADVEAARPSGPDLFEGDILGSGTPQDRLLSACDAASARFKNPNREFVAEAEGHYWLADSEVLRAMNRKGPVKLDDLTETECELARRLVNDILAQKEASRGRAG